MSIFAIITTVIQAANAADRDTLFVLRSLGILSCAGCSGELKEYVNVIKLVGVLFGPKLYYIRKNYTIDTGAPRLSRIFDSKEIKYLRSRVQQLEKFLKDSRIEAPKPLEEFDYDDYYVTSNSSSVRE